MADKVDEQSNGMALAALILGILGLLIPLAGIICAILAVIFGILGVKKASIVKKGKGMAIAGIVMGSVGIIALPLLASIGALAYFGVFSPDNMIPARTSFQHPLPNEGVADYAQDGTVTIRFMNAVGEFITLPGTVSGTMDCADATFVSGIYDGSPTNEGTAIPNGAVFILKFGCDEMDVDDLYKATLSFDYVPASGDPRTSTGSLSGRVK